MISNNRSKPNEKRILFTLAKEKRKQNAKHNNTNYKITLILLASKPLYVAIAVTYRQSNWEGELNQDGRNFL